MIDLIICSLAGALAGAFGVLVVQAFIKIQKLNRKLEEDCRSIATMNENCLGIKKGKR